MTGGAPPGLPPLARKLRTLVLVRLAVAIGILGTLLAAELGWGEERGRELVSPAVPYAYYLYPFLLGLIAADGLWWALLRAAVGCGRLAAVTQLAVDLVAVTGIVTCTGGEGSRFVVLFFGPVLAASLLLPFLWGLGAALLSGGLLAGVAWLYHWAATAVPLRTLPLLGIVVERSQATWGLALLGSLLLATASFLGVAVLGGTLATRLSRVRVLLDEVLQNLGEGVVAVDSLGRIAFVNREAARLLGAPDERRLLDRPAAAVFAEASGTLREMLLSGGGGPMEVDVPGGGGRLPVEASVSLVRDDAGRPRGTVVVLRDVTLRREVARARAQASRLQAISEMAAGLAHEIRNPLASIRGSIQELIEGARATTEVRRLMEIAITESDRLDGIITQFLEFARSRAPRPRPLAARPLLEEMAILLEKRGLPAGTGVAIEAAPEVAVYADAEQIRQVLLNLGLNAIEAMPGGGTLTLAALRAPVPSGAYDGRLPAAATGVSVQVRDTGVGIAPENIPQLGNPFFTTKPGGTGLGLAIVHRVVEAHGGVVRVVSSPGSGTTLDVWWPDRTG